MKTAAGYPPLADAYTVRATRWAHGWELHFGEKDADGDAAHVTQSHCRADAEAMVRDYLACTYDLTAEEAAALDVEIVRLAKRKPSKRRAR